MWTVQKNRFSCALLEFDQGACCNLAQQKGKKVNVVNKYDRIIIQLVEVLIPIIQRKQQRKSSKFTCDQFLQVPFDFLPYKILNSTLSLCQHRKSQLNIQSMLGLQELQMKKILCLNNCEIIKVSVVERVGCSAFHVLHVPVWVSSHSSNTCWLAELVTSNWLYSKSDRIELNLNKLCTFCQSCATSIE